MKDSKPIKRAIVVIFFVVAGHLIFSEGEAPRHGGSGSFFATIIIITMIGLVLFWYTKDV